MAENTSEQVEATEAQEAKREFKPIESQEALDKLISERVSRERKKYADYEDLKAKAAQFDELEEANKTELEKAQEKIAQLEAEKEANAKKAELAEMRAKVAKETGIPEALIKGSTEEEMQEFATSIAAYAKAQKPAAPALNEAGKHVTGEMPGDAKRQMLKQLLPN